MRTGDTTFITIAFDEPLGELDLVCGLYDTDDNCVYLAKLSEGTINNIGNKVYQIIIPWFLTKEWEGKYYGDLMVKNPNDTSYVNIGETSFKVNFKKAPIAKNITA